MLVSDKCGSARFARCCIWPGRLLRLHATASFSGLAKPRRLPGKPLPGWPLSGALALPVVAFGMTLSACAMTPTIAPDSACLAFAPITFSASTDSTETVRQIREHNAAWRAICDD